MNVDDALRHLDALYGLAIEQSIDVAFEVRCLREERPTQWCRFVCTEHGLAQATVYARERNAEGYNIYVTANLLRPDSTGTACDDKVLCAAVQFIDADGSNERFAAMLDRDELEAPAFVVITGQTPTLRLHAYWQLDGLQFDMGQWRDTQARLSAYCGTDPTVQNPSRVVRLAGTLTYPPTRKRDRGYIGELTGCGKTPCKIRHRFDFL